MEGAIEGDHQLALACLSTKSPTLRFRLSRSTSKKLAAALRGIRSR